MSCCCRRWLGEIGRCAFTPGRIYCPSPRAAISCRPIWRRFPDPVRLLGTNQGREGLSMTSAKRFACIFLAGTAVLAPGTAIAQSAPVSAPQGEADAKLRALYDGYAAWDARESEVFEDPRGET